MSNKLKTDIKGQQLLGVEKSKHGHAGCAEIKPSTQHLCAEHATWANRDVFQSHVLFGGLVLLSEGDEINLYVYLHLSLILTGHSELLIYPTLFKPNADSSPARGITVVWCTSEETNAQQPALSLPHTALWALETQDLSCCMHPFLLSVSISEFDISYPTFATSPFSSNQKINSSHLNQPNYCFCMEKTAKNRSDSQKESVIYKRSTFSVAFWMVLKI